MQECFRQHPDVYGAEFDDDDEEGAGDHTPAAGENSAVAGSDKAPVGSDGTHPPEGTSSIPVVTPRPGGAEKVSDHTVGHEPKDPAEAESRRQNAIKATEQVQRDFEPESETKTAVPKAAHDDVSSTDEEGGSKKGGW